MIIFLFLGQNILSLSGVAAAFILFFIALEMILGITLYKEEDDNTAIPVTYFRWHFH